MRLLRLDFRDQKATLDLHPLLTVISGQNTAIQAPLFAALRRLSLGETVGLRGLIQHEGLLFELNPALDRPLGVVSTSTTVLLPVDAVSGPTAIALRDELQNWDSQAMIDRIAAADLRFHRGTTGQEIEAADQAANRAVSRLKSLEQRMELVASGVVAQSERDILGSVTDVVSQLEKDLSGSTPLAIIGNFSALGQDSVNRLFQGLSELAHLVQLIVITENDAAFHWVQGAGAQIAMVSSTRSRGARPIDANS